MTAITLVQGHPDASRPHLCHAMAEAYASGAADGGHAITSIDIARIAFPLIRSEADFVDGDIPDAIRDAQECILAARHLVLVYPLWLGTMPALLKAFFEQVLRYGFAIEESDKGTFKKMLTGRSARIIVTMGMPVLACRWFFGAHSLKNLERNILTFSGIKPIRESLFGGVDNVDDSKRKQWLADLYQLGQNAR